MKKSPIEVKNRYAHRHDSLDSQDAESMHSGQFSHVPRESAIFLPEDERGGLLGHTKIMPPSFWDAQFSTEDVFARLHVHPSSSYTWIPTPWNNPDTGRVPKRTSTVQFALEDGDGGKGSIPNPRCLRSSMTGNSFDAM